MKSGVLIISITTLFAGLLIIGLSIPLILKKIKPNYFYGFRIPKAFASEENWYKINKYGGNLMLVWGIVISSCSLTVLIIPSILSGLAGYIVMIPYLLLIPLIIMVFVYAKRL